MSLAIQAQKEFDRSHNRLMVREAEERLYNSGAEHLSDREALALLSGLTVDRAREILNTHSFAKLENLPVSTLSELMGDRAARAFVCALEVGRRAARQRVVDTLEFSSPESIYRFMAPRLSHLQKERFIALALNTKNRLIREITVSEGDLNSSVVHPREVFQPLILESASAVIFVHNHPSGDPTPSQRDVEVTQRLRQAGELLGIKVLDHVVVASGGFYSFQAHGFFAGNSALF
jgi:DNA repair protein RadC